MKRAELFRLGEPPRCLSPALSFPLPPTSLCLTVHTLTLLYHDECICSIGSVTNSILQNPIARPYRQGRPPPVLQHGQPLSTALEAPTFSVPHSISHTRSFSVSFCCLDNRTTEAHTLRRALSGVSAPSEATSPEEQARVCRQDRARSGAVHRCSRSLQTLGGA